MSDIGDYWLTFWESVQIKSKSKTYTCWGIAVENHKVISVLIENGDGSREYVSNKDLINDKILQEYITPHIPKRKRKCQK